MYIMFETIEFGRTGYYLMFLTLVSFFDNSNKCTIRKQ